MYGRLVIPILFVIASFSGCLANEPSDTTTTTSATGSTSPSTTGTSGTSSPAPTGSSSAPQPPIANLTVDTVNGSAPLEVGFAILDDAAEPASPPTWTLDFGDGNTTNGTDVPGRANHSYAVAGVYEVVLVLTTPGGESSDNETITVEAVVSNAPPPSQTEYSTGPVAGCVTEAGHQACPAYVAGPGGEDGLGLWIQLEPGHIGMTFTTVGGAEGDSDGWVFADPEGAPIAGANINNGSDEATGVVEEGWAYLLIVSWAAPSEGLTVTFTP